LLGAKLGQHGDDQTSAAEFQPKILEQLRIFSTV
jgi:hypothetical protein